MVLVILLVITAFIVAYRINDGKNIYQFVTRSVASAYNKYAPYSFKMVREKAKQLGQEYTPRQYAMQAVIFAVVAGGIAYLYFFSFIWALVYAGVSILFIPYLAYLRCQRVYSEFIFEQIQTYTSNVIMEFNTTQSFVKALEGVRDSGILEEPVLGDVKKMIELSYENGTIDESITYFNEKYPYYMVKNMHQLFLQITKEGAIDSGDALENMSMDIDALVEGVYRDRMDRQQFHRKFITFGVALYFLVLAMIMLLGKDKYIALLDMMLVKVILHAIIIINSCFLMSGEKYYNADVGVE